MALPHPLPDPLIKLLAVRLRVMSDITRIRLIDSLRDGTASVQELTDRSRTTQQNVSKHLGVLHRAGVVARTRTGRTVGYRLTDATALQVLACAARGLPDDKLSL